MWVLGTELGSFGRAVWALNYLALLLFVVVVMVLVVVF